jgi:hypothetical protein
MSTTDQTPAGSGLLPHSGVRLSEGYADVGDVKLHYVEAGDGPFCSTASRSSGTAGGYRSSRS